MCKINIYRIIRILSLFLLIAIIITINACKKTDIPVNSVSIADEAAIEQFLSVTCNAKPVINRIINTIINQEEKYHFLNKVINREGYAKWENAQIILLSSVNNNKITTNTIGNGHKINSDHKSVTDTLVLVPLVLPNTKYVNSFIMCKLNDKVSIKLFRGSDYASYGFRKTADSINAQKIATTCILLEAETFKHNEFSIKDTRLFNYLPDNKVPGKTTVKIRKPSTNNDNNGIVRNGFVTLFYSYEIEVYNQLQDVYCPVGQGCEWTHTETIYDSYTFYVENIPGASTTFGADYNPWGNYDPCGGVPCTPVIDAWQYSGVGSTDPTPPALFNWTYSGDDGSAFTDPDPSLEPDLQFDPADGYETLYPNFTNVVKNLKTFVKNSPEVMSALQKWSGFTKQQILDKLTFGKGPTVKVVEGLDSYSSYNRATNESVLKMSASWVRGLEAAVLPATKRGTAFIIAVSILHEFVHYGTGRNNISEGQYDFGWGFERSAFHVIVNDLNANEVSLRFKKLP